MYIKLYKHEYIYIYIQVNPGQAGWRKFPLICYYIGSQKQVLPIASCHATSHSLATLFSEFVISMHALKLNYLPTNHGRGGSFNDIKCASGRASGLCIDRLLECSCMHAPSCTSCSMLHASMSMKQVEGMHALCTSAPQHEHL